MKKKDKIFLAGHNGLVGNAVFNELKKKILIECLSQIKKN